jgi:DNA replication initiation complex subunit (GINS family)
MVTYADIQRIYRVEKASVELQKIDEGFYMELPGLLSSIDVEHREHIKKMGYEIFERRRNKIVLAALRSSDKTPANMISTERFLYEEASKLFSLHKGLVFAECKTKDSEENTEKKISLMKVKVRFLAQLPAIVGSDLVHYGPFNEGDTSELPIDNARVLVEREIAEEL